MVPSRFRVSLLSLGMLASGLDSGADGCDSCHPKPSNPPAIDVNVEYTINVLPVLLADDDGSHSATVTRAMLQAYMDEASAIYQRSGAKLHFVIAPEADFSGRVRSSLMNHDCLPKTKTPEQFTDPNLDPNTICDTIAVDDARSAYALKTPSRLVIFMRYFGDYPTYVNGRWSIVFQRVGGGFSWGTTAYVAGVDGGAGSTFYAHEMGHYLHLAHPHSRIPANLAEAKQIATDYVQLRIGSSGFDPVLNGLEVFDGDRFWNWGVSDTPPDPSMSLWANVYGSECETQHTSLDIDISVSGVPYRLTAKPDRQLVMSYYKHCAWDQHISAGETARVMEGLQRLNRRTLVNPSLDSCYASHNIQGGSGTDKDLVVYRLGVINACLATLSSGGTASISQPFSMEDTRRGNEPCDVPAN